MRVRGCTTDKERRDFAEALSRKRRRTAFPDDFNNAVSNLHKDLKKKKNAKQLAHVLREIRVRAAPEWAAPKVNLTFYFILNEEVALPWPMQGEEVIKLLMNRFDQTTRFRLDEELPWRLCCLADLSADEYVYFDQLDLDKLSQSYTGP